MADVPVGISQAEIIKALAGLRAFGEIMKIDPPLLDTILDKARKEMELKPETPGPPDDG